MRRQVILASAAALLLAACSGDGGAAPSSSEETASTSASVATPETTAPPTTTTLPPTTSNPTTTVPAATAPPTTEATTTTTTMLPEGVPPRVTFPDDPEKQAVVDAAYAFFDAARAAQAAPDDEALRAELADTMVDPIASRMVEFLDRLIADDERIVADPDQPTYLDVFPSTVFTIDGSGILDACAVDGDVRVSGPVGVEIVVDDDLVSGVQTYSLIMGGNGWRVRDFTTVERFEGRAGCG